MAADLEKQINESLLEGKLSCPVAFKVAKKAGVPTREVGEKADELGIRISNCQLGCFGAKKATHTDLIGVQVSEKTAAAIRESLVEGKLPCASAHELARQMKISRKKVGDTATQLHIHVSDCQLGCF